MLRRSPAIVVAALAPVVLVAADPAGWYPFGPVKWAAVTVLLLAGAALVSARRPLRLDRRITITSLALLGWLAVASAVGEDGLYGWIGTPERHLGFVAWALFALALAVGQSLETTDHNVVVRGLVVAGAAVGVVAGIEAAGWEPDLLDVSPRLSGPLGSPAYLGAASALLLPPSIGVAADRTWPRAWRVAAGTATALLAVAVIGAGARAAWLGLLAAALAAAWSHRSRITAHRRVAAAATAAAFVALGILVVAGPVGDRLTSTFDRSEPGGRGRLDEWAVAVRVVADRPVTGTGPEGYRIAFGGAVDERYQRTHGRDPLPDRAHSAPLDVALAGGLPALVAWSVLVVLVGRAVRHGLRSGQPWLAGLSAGLVAHAVGSLALFPVVEVEPVAWLAGGMVVAATRRGRPRGWSVPRPATVTLALLAGVALAAGALDVAADRRAARAAHALGAGDGATAAREAAGAVRLRPDEVRLHLLDARARVADEQGALAGLAAVDEALDLSPRDPVARRERARLLVARAEATRAPDHITAAREDLAVLLGADPLEPRLWALAAVAADLAGDRAAAEEAIARAAELEPRDGT